MFTASNLVIYHPLGAPDDALLLCQNPRLGAERKKKKLYRQLHHKQATCYDNTPKPIRQTHNSRTMMSLLIKRQWSKVGAVIL